MVILPSSCPARCTIDGYGRQCIEPDPEHDGPHMDADGEWIIDGLVTVIDAKERWLSFGSWW